MNPIKEAYQKYVLPIYKDNVKFLVSSLDDAAAAVLGASAIVGKCNCRSLSTV